MSEVYARYRRFTALYVWAQEAGIEDMIDTMLDELDAVWYHDLGEKEKEFDRRWNLFLHEKRTCGTDGKVRQ
jgi:hypothetical protein